MKSIKTLFSALCVATILSLPGYSISSDRTELVGLRRASDMGLYQHVEKELDQRISSLEESLKENIPYVEEVFYGSTVEGELGVEIKIYKNKKKNDYYYFLMTTVDKYTKYTNQSSKSRFLLLNDLCFSFDKARFLSKLADYPGLREGESSGRAKGTTFILDNSVKEFYLGLKYYDHVEKREGRLVYLLKILPRGGGYVFEGYANGSVSFQEKDTQTFAGEGEN